VTAVTEEAVTEAPAFTGVLQIPGREDITWDASDDAQVAAACAAFSQTLTETRGAAYNDADELIREFDPEAKTIRMFTQLQGG
jgi:hypothetical protein